MILGTVVILIAMLCLTILIVQRSSPCFFKGFIVALLMLTIVILLLSLLFAII